MGLSSLAKASLDAGTFWPARRKFRRPVDGLAVVNDIRVTSIACSVFPSHNSIRAFTSLVTLQILKCGFHLFRHQVSHTLQPQNGDECHDYTRDNACPRKSMSSSVLQAMFCHSGSPDRCCCGFDARSLGFPACVAFSNVVGVVGSDASVDDCIQNNRPKRTPYHSS